jgi:hypothetical protein
VWRRRKVGKTTTKKSPAFGDFGFFLFFFVLCSFGFCGFCDKQVTCLQHIERDRDRESEEVRKGRSEGRRKEGGMEGKRLTCLTD